MYCFRVYTTSRACLVTKAEPLWCVGLHNSVVISAPALQEYVLQQQVTMCVAGSWHHDECVWARVLLAHAVNKTLRARVKRLPVQPTQSAPSCASMHVRLGEGVSLLVLGVVWLARLWLCMSWAGIRTRQFACGWVLYASQLLSTACYNLEA